MKFEDYHIIPEIKKSLSELGFKRPTDIQFKAIPNILNGEDVLAIAQTGTGKTAAFAIPIIHLISKAGVDQGVQAVVMVPTHELAIKITDVFQSIGKYTDVRTLALYGGVAITISTPSLNCSICGFWSTPPYKARVLTSVYFPID